MTFMTAYRPSMWFTVIVSTQHVIAGHQGCIKYLHSSKHSGEPPCAWSYCCI